MFYGQSGGSLSSGLNVYAQLEEPSKKDGVWIKTEETVVDENTILPEISKYKYDKVELMENSDIVGKGIYTKLANIPYPLNSGSAVAIGTNVYLLGNSSGTDYSNYVSNNYKYDTTTNKYTKLADIPYPFNDGCATVVEKYIYLFGGGSTTYYRNAYKYDTLTNTYTKLANTPYPIFDSSAISIGNNIYLFGGGSTTYYRSAYKYDTLTNTYTKLADIPYDFDNGSAVAIGTNVYLLGSNFNNNNSANAYKYNTLTNEYTKLADIPNKYFYGTAITIDNDIYLLNIGERDGLTRNNYKYNTLTNEYTKLADIPYPFNNVAVPIKKSIYLFGGSIYSNNTSYQKNAYKFEVKFPKNIEIVIEIKSIYNTKITKILQIEFSKVFIYNNKLLDYPVYYGNGQEWINTKTLKAERSIITEEGEEIKTEDNKIIEKEGEV